MNGSGEGVVGFANLINRLKTHADFFLDGQSETRYPNATG